MSQLAERYANFLNHITLNTVSSNFNEDDFTITVPFLNKELLLLRKDVEASNDERILYRIVGGDLALDSKGGNARLEFRRLPNSSECIIALQEYEPTLPWWVYKYTQAKIHKSVMNLFKLKLRSKKCSRSRDKVTIILPVILIGSMIFKLYAFKQHSARSKHATNVER